MKINSRQIQVAHRRGRAALSGLVYGLTDVARHEVHALGGHAAEVRERLAVARRAGGVIEMLRDQVDLLPETRARLAVDARTRRLLLEGCWRSIRDVEAA